MNPNFRKRLALAGPPGTGSIEVGVAKNDRTFSEPSVRDQAALLLSIADIAKSEIHDNGLQALWWDDGKILPLFPKLSETAHGGEHMRLAPRTDSLQGLLVASSMEEQKQHLPSNRVRLVSLDMDTTYEHEDWRTTSPVSLNTSKINLVSPMQSPQALVSNRRLPLRKQSLRLSVKARKEDHQEEEDEEECPTPTRTVAFADHKKKALQGACARGIPIKKILRKKFSWKNYPEVSSHVDECA
jgi:hypothetical protein